MSNTSTGAQPESGGKGLFELIIATLPAVLLYFFGWPFCISISKPSASMCPSWTWTYKRSSFTPFRRYAL
jgi:hypothetical protein